MSIASEVLRKMGAVITGDHFVYTSGKHGEAYVAKDKLYESPESTAIVCQDLALAISDFCLQNKLRNVTILAPVVGGVALSQWVGYHLKKNFNTDCVAVFADKEQIAVDLGDPNTMVKINGKYQALPEGSKLFIETGNFVIKRGYEKHVAGGKDVIVLEDILNTGGSAAATVQAVKAAGGNVRMVAAICNRGGVTAEKLEVPYLYSAINVSLDTHPVENCPFCKEGRPINTSYGHGKAFLQAKQTA